MAGENDGFNGSTISFGGADQTPLIAIDYDSSGSEVDVTGNADTNHTYECGLANDTITWEIVGKTTLTEGSQGAVVVAWKDGNNYGGMTNSVITSIEKGGGLDGAVTTRITAKPTAA